MGRFTLTSDNRLIPSPAENRGRPRKKVRVEKTQHVPIGTAQEIARSRAPGDGTTRDTGGSVLIRKHPSSPVVRTSVIQGSTHAPVEGSTLNKMMARNAGDVHPLYQHSTV